MCLGTVGLQICFHLFTSCRILHTAITERTAPLNLLYGVICTFLQRSEPVVRSVEKVSAGRSPISEIILSAESSYDLNPSISSNRYLF